MCSSKLSYLLYLFIYWLWQVGIENAGLEACCYIVNLHANIERISYIWYIVNTDLMIILTVN